jgi:tetratricopeptide (TPR) repeat protein
MKPTTRATTVLLVATIAAVGCSKKGVTSQEKTGAPASTQASANTLDLSHPVGLGEDDLAAVVTKIDGPVTFADGEAAYQAKKYGDAMAIFERYAAQRPKNPWGHYMLGLSAWKNGDLAKAEQAFERALAIDPNHVKSLLNESRVFLELKKHDEAIDRLTRAEAIEPDSVQVLRLLARTYHAQGRTNEAIATYRHAIEVNALDVWSMNNLGLVLLETNRADEALPLFAEAAERRSDVAAFHNNLGMALEHTGRFRAAATAYTSALATDPGYAKAKQNLARVEAVRKTEPEEPVLIGAIVAEPQADAAAAK